MNNGIAETISNNSRTGSGRNLTAEDELARTKRELLKAEVRLAKARATVVTTEIDVRMLSARLKVLVK